MADSARLDELRRRFEENPRRYFAPLASALRRGGDARAAAALARSQLAVYPGHLTGHVILGQALVDLGDAPAARGAFARAAALDPGNVVALQQLVALAREAGDGDALRVWSGRLAEADPELAAEVAAAAAEPAFEPLDLEPFGTTGAGHREAAHGAGALDPRLAVAADAAAVEEPAAVVDGDATGPDAAAVGAPLDGHEHATAAPATDAADAAPAAAGSEIHPVVGLDLAPDDPVPMPMREALPALLADAPQPNVSAAEPGELDAGVSDEAGGGGMVVPPPAAPFVTETMAALLAAQGHTAEAADVYERLLARTPDDARLRARVDALRAAPAAAPAAAAADGTSTDDSADEAAARMWRAAMAPIDESSAPADVATPAAPTGTSAALPDGLRDEAPDDAPSAWPQSADARTSDARPGESSEAPDLDGAGALAPPAEPVRAAGPPPGAAETFEDLSFDQFFADVPVTAPAGDIERWAAEPDRAAVADDDSPSATDVDAPAAGLVAATHEHAWDDAATNAAAAQPAGAPSNADDLSPAAPVTTPAEPTASPPDEVDDDLAQFNAWLRGLAE